MQRCAQVEHKRGVPRGPTRVQSASFQAIAGYHPDTAQLKAAMDEGFKELTDLLQTPPELCGEQCSVWDSLKRASRQPNHPLPLLPAAAAASSAEPDEPDSHREEEDDVMDRPAASGFWRSWTGKVRSFSA